MVKPEKKGERKKYVSGLSVVARPGAFLSDGCTFPVSFEILCKTK